MDVYVSELEFFIRYPLVWRAKINYGIEIQNIYLVASGIFHMGNFRTITQFLIKD